MAAAWDNPWLNVETRGRCKACVGVNDTDIYTDKFKIATQWLYDATAHRFPGLSPIVIRPYRSGCECVMACNCATPNVMTLDLREAFAFPVGFNANDYPLITVVENGTQWVYGTDFWMSDPWTMHTCKGRWPTQTLCVHPGLAGTWEIMAMIGNQPPPLLVQAAADLACELLKAHKGEDNCLPDGVKTVSRRGLTMDVQETVTFDGEKTGIATVDMAVKTYGPGRGDAWHAFVESRTGWSYMAHRGSYFLSPPTGFPTGAGDMFRAIYDPTSISDDAFDLANQFGILDSGTF
jgi:hypothetical protein